MARRSEIRWLLGELPGLVESGVLSEEAARKLRARYPDTDAGRERHLSHLLFGAIGTLLVGAGVILVFAHNWSDLSRPARTAISLGQLLAVQVLAGWVLLRRRASVAWRESAAIALTFAVGAAISLVSQTWHVEGTLADFFLVWMVLAIPVVYLFDSHSASACCWVGITAYTLGESFASPRMEWVFWLLAASLLPHLVLSARRRATERSTAFVVLVAVVCVPMAAMETLQRAAPQVQMFFWVGLTSALWTAAGAGRGAGEPWRRVAALAGFLGMVACAVGYSFLDPWDWTSTAGRAPRFPWGNGVHLAIGLAGAGIALIVAWRALSQRRWHDAVAGALIVPSAIGWAGNLAGQAPAGAIAFDAWLLATGILVLVAGLKTDALAMTNAGLVALGALLVARFFDTDLSFLARGIAFIALGLGFLYVNLRVLGRRRREA